jgi:deazaflavin-dependent oxidoreductase (nitroreductase family)
MPEVQPESQTSEPFEEPPREEIPGISRGHVAAMEASDADEVWCLAGMHHVILHTIGRKSGNEHKVALPFWVDEQGNRVIVASFSGAPDHPAWYLNLSDRDANPEVRVRVQGGEFWADPQVLEGSDYAATWTALNTDRPWYDDYQSRTDRQIPLVRLIELRPA